MVPFLLLSERWLTRGRRVVKGGKAIVLTREERSTESDDEPTPFKKVMSKKRKRFGKDISVNVAEESTPIKVAVKGTRKVKVPAEDSATEVDEPIVPQKTGNAKAAPAEAKWVLKDPAVVSLASGSDNEPIQTIPAMSSTKPGPFKEQSFPWLLLHPKKWLLSQHSIPGPPTKSLTSLNPNCQKQDHPRQRVSCQW